MKHVPKGTIVLLIIWVAIVALVWFVVLPAVSAEARDDELGAMSTDRFFNIFIREPQWTSLPSPRQYSPA